MLQKRDKITSYNENDVMLQKKNFSSFCLAKYKNNFSVNLMSNGTRKSENSSKLFKIDSSNMIFKEDKIPSNVFFKIQKDFPEFVSKGDFPRKNPFNENDSKNKFKRLIDQTLFKK